MTEESDDYYSILAVDVKADFETIRSAYRRCVREYHPDVNDAPQAHERFKRISQAYEVLSDEKKRKQYDTLRAFSFGMPLDQLKKKFSDPAVINAFFKKVATGLATAAGLFRNTKPEPGRDLTVYERISFRESFSGTDVSVDYLQPVACDPCRGTGFSQVEPCGVCSGEGKLQSENFAGLRKRCPRCDGQGWSGIEKCENCQGEGRVSQSRSVTINIPAGVQDGQRIRVRGRGEGGRGHAGSGKAGDLMLVVSVDPEAGFERAGQDLRVAIDIPLKTAAFGGRVERAMPLGAMAFEIPPGTWSGRILRVVGAGFPDARTGNPGDCFLTVAILPGNSEQERNLHDRYIRTVRGKTDALENELAREIDGFSERKEP